MSQKLHDSLDSFHAGSQVTLGLANWIWIGMQVLSKLTIGFRLTKNSLKPHETVGANPTTTANFNAPSYNWSVYLALTQRVLVQVQQEQPSFSKHVVRRIG